MQVTIIDLSEREKLVRPAGKHRVGFTAQSMKLSYLPTAMSDKRHIISILLQNEAGALTRVAGLFSNRGYNIESLNVAPTDDATVSRLTLVTTGTDAVLEQVVNQSLKLVDVVNVDDLTRDAHVERELLLLKLQLNEAKRAAFQTAANNMGAKVLSDDKGTLVIELTASVDMVNRFVTDAAAYGEVLEVARSGLLAMLRGGETLRS
jgi:acetolactate synthase-1/3 small subunit